MRVVETVQEMAMAMARMEKRLMDETSPIPSELERVQPLPPLEFEMPLAR